LTPLESSFSSSDLGNKEKNKEEDSKRKVGETISLNIGTLESLENVKIGAQCFYDDKMKFAKLLGIMRIFVFLILILYNMPFPSRKE
jgi:hypothetical protein